MVRKIYYISIRTGVKFSIFLELIHLWAGNKQDISQISKYNKDNPSTLWLDRSGLSSSLSAVDTRNDTFYGLLAFTVSLLGWASAIWEKECKAEGKGKARAIEKNGSDGNQESRFPLEDFTRVQMCICTNNRVLPIGKQKSPFNVQFVHLEYYCFHT